jgi:hypothetical protein
MRQPQVGDPIRFFQTDGSDRAAIVTAVVGVDLPISLCWFAGTDAEQPVNRVTPVPFGPPNQPGCWRWLASQG